MGDQKPTFDFSKVSRQWSKAFSKSIMNATRAQIILNQPFPQLYIPKGTNKDAAQLIRQQFQSDAQKLRVEQDEAVQIIEELGDEQAELVAQVLRFVPGEWLIEGAPAVLDWGEIESFDWIQEDRYAEILEMIQSGEARILAKN